MTILRVDPFQACLAGWEFLFVAVPLQKSKKTDQYPLSIKVFLNNPTVQSPFLLSAIACVQAYNFEQCVTMTQRCGAGSVSRSHSTLISKRQIGLISKSRKDHKNVYINKWRSRRTALERNVKAGSR
jgi:hypothetical protein